MNLNIKNTGIIFILFLVSCGNVINKKQNKENARIANPVVRDITGSYVSDSYNQRNEGYDWVSVSVKRTSAEEIFISVRSRADLKKPTCTFDTKAYKTNDSTYIAVSDGKNITIQFRLNKVKIKTEKPEDENILYFFCSGGATIAGTYIKTEGPLDSSQIDRTSFSKILRLQDVGFNVTAKPDGDKNKLEIYPFGLLLNNQTLTKNFEGKVMDAETEDLNSDGFPEVLVYINLPNKKSTVIGISINNETTASPIIFPAIEDNQEVFLGYHGEDDFSIVENSLVRRFPIFENGEKIGKIRQIEYKMEVHETKRYFSINRVTEF